MDYNSGPGGSTCFGKRIQSRLHRPCPSSPSPKTKGEMAGLGADSGTETAGGLAWPQGEGNTLESPLNLWSVLLPSLTESILENKDIKSMSVY